MKRLAWVLSTAVIAGCSGSTSQAPCGPGTTEVQGECVPAGGKTGGGLSCGPGTKDVGGQCVPAGATGGLSCGPGTKDVGGQCVPAGGTGGSGTGGIGTGGIGSGGSGTGGVGSGGSGAGGSGAGGGLSCGPGTEEMQGQCVPTTPTYEVLVGASAIPADGYSAIPVYVVSSDQGTNPNADDVVLALSRPNAGSLTPAVLHLGPLGSNATFIPCNGSQDPACLGPFFITLAQESSPTTVLAQSPMLNLTTQMGVGSDAPCLVGGNVLYFDGAAGDYIHPGMATIQQGAWSANASATHVGD